MLRSLTVHGVRGVDATIEFTWPVTAIGGTNGSGKTTFLQVASAAYVAEAGRRQVNLGSWIRGALRGDTPPITVPAHIQYAFADSTPTFRVDYLPARTRWNYPRRGNPQRNVEFVGITTFAPRVEKKDRVHHARGNLQILRSARVDDLLTQSVSRILGATYTELNQHTVGVEGKWQDSVPQLSRGIASYSEPHMGAGEQKVVRLVQRLEQVPPKSLILLEEPELTLHPDAQVGLAWYLMSLARRKGHQVLIATHSEHLFQSLPIQARALLVRTADQLEVLHEVSSLRAARELTNSMQVNAPIVLVEDDAACSFLREIFRQIDRALISQCAVVAVGNDDDVRRLTETLRDSGVKVVGVRDGDRGEARNDMLFSLPGGAPPESVLLTEENLQKADQMLLAGAAGAYQRASPVGAGHPPAERDKRILPQMARELDVTVEDLASRLTQVWILNNRDTAVELVHHIRRGLENER